jgi:hypothetical protein
LDADLGELVFLSGNPTQDTIDRMEGYLAWKWGLDANLPAGHPYQDAAPLVPTELPPVWSDDFEAYSPGNIDGQGPWVDFGGTLPGIVSTAQANSGVQSLALTLNPADDGSYGSDVYIVALDNGTVLTSGSWALSYQMFVPSDYEGQLHMYISQGEMPTDFRQGAWLLATEGDVLQYNFGGTTPLVLDEWAEVKLEVDLDTDTVTISYDGTPIYTGAWAIEGPPGPALGGINFWADGGPGLTGTAYIDDFVLSPTAEFVIPEPASLSLLALGALGLLRKRRKH